MTPTGIGLRVRRIALLCGLLIFLSIGPGFFTKTILARTSTTCIANGRVMDPESGLDSVRNVGVNGGKIVAVSAKPLRGGPP